MQHRHFLNSIYGKKIVLALLALCVVLLIAQSSAQAQYFLIAKKVWQYGNGTIKNIAWIGDRLALSSETGIQFTDSTFSSLTTYQDDLLLSTAAFYFADATDGYYVTVNEPRVLQFDSPVNRLSVRKTEDNGSVFNIEKPLVPAVAALRPQGILLAVNSYNPDVSEDVRYTVSLWDFSTRKMIKSLGGYRGYITGMAWSPDGKQLAVLTVDGNYSTLSIEDVQSGTNIRTLILGLPAERAVVAWSADRLHLAVNVNSGNTPLETVVYDTGTWKAATLLSVPLFVGALAWDASGHRLAGALADGTTGIWDKITGQTIILRAYDPDYNDDMVYAVGVRQIVWHGDQLATLNYFNHARVWDATTAKLLGESKSFETRIQKLAVNPQGTLAAVEYYGSTRIDIINTIDGTLRESLKVEYADFVDLIWSPAGDQLAATNTGSTYIWKFSAGPPTRMLLVQNQAFYTHMITWLGDDVLAASIREQEVRLFNTQTGEQIGDPRIVKGIYEVKGSPDGRYLAMYIYNPVTEPPTPGVQIDVWDRRSNNTITLVFPYNGIYRRMSLSGFQWLPDSGGLTGMLFGGTLWRWSIGDERVRLVNIGDLGDTTNQDLPFQVDSAGKRVVTTDVRNGIIFVTDLDTGQTFPVTVFTDSTLLVWSSDLLLVGRGAVTAYRLEPQTP